MDCRLPRHFSGERRCHRSQRISPQQRQTLQVEASLFPVHDEGFSYGMGIYCAPNPITAKGYATSFVDSDVGKRPRK